ncbi:MAG: hypothetical protein ACM3KE_06830, partial [Hyphomicrobiales bacterium]
ISGSARRGLPSTLTVSALVLSPLGESLGFYSARLAAFVIPVKAGIQENCWIPGQARNDR